MSPSWGGAGAFPHRVQRGVAQLEALGFHVKLGRHALNQRGVVSDTPEHRAADLQAMFHDPDVRAIIATIGGDHACHVLPLLDFASLRDSPTIFMGYSDMTVLNIAIWQQTGVVTCHGPMLLTDFAEYPRLFAYTKQSFLRTVCEARPVGRVAPCDAWTEEFLDWAEHKDLERPRRRAPSPGWTWLRPGHAEGILLGGCLESLPAPAGTAFWPDWAEAILFLETSEEKPSPATVAGGEHTDHHAATVGSFLQR